MFSCYSFSSSEIEKMTDDKDDDNSTNFLEPDENEWRKLVDE